MLGPEVVALFKQAVRREKDEHTARRNPRYPCYRLAQINVHRQTVPVFVAEIEALVVGTFLKNAD